MRFDINDEAGTSHAIGLYDHPYTEETPDPTRAFGFSRGGRVIQYKGFDYLVHDESISAFLKEMPFVPWSYGAGLINPISSQLQKRNGINIG